MKILLWFWLVVLSILPFSIFINHFYDPNILALFLVDCIISIPFTLLWGHVLGLWEDR
jgi:hypothetical protein